MVRTGSHEMDLIAFKFCFTVLAYRDGLEPMWQLINTQLTLLYIAQH